MPTNVQLYDVDFFNDLYFETSALKHHTADILKIGQCQIMHFFLLSISLGISRLKQFES